MIQLKDNEIYRAELAKVSLACPDMTMLGGHSVLVTGATGLIGSAIVDLLSFLNETLDLKIRIYAAGRKIEKLTVRFDEPTHFLNYVEYDADRGLRFDQPVDYIIHAASNAQPGLYVSQPVETMVANFCGVRDLLEFAKNNQVKRVLYVSSSEVYGQKQEIGAFGENDYGHIDITNVRSSYAMSKRASETLCRAYWHEYHIDTVMVRPGHIYGPTAPTGDNRVVAQFAEMASRGEDLVMKSKGLQLRSYCHSLDCASAILMVLLKGASGESYNISNKHSVITIRQMAEMLAEKSQVSLRFDCPTSEEQMAFNPMNNSSLNAEKLESLGWVGCMDAESGLGEYVEILKEVAGRKV